LEHFERLIQSAVDAVPACLGAPRLKQLVRSQAERLVPKAWTPALARNTIPSIAAPGSVSSRPAIPATGPAL
jgi:hypothetical protein